MASARRAGVDRGRATDGRDLLDDVDPDSTRRWRGTVGEGYGRLEIRYGRGNGKSEEY